MKRSICLFLSILLTLSTLPFPTSAESYAETVLVSKTTEFLADGSYVLIAIYENSVQTRSSTYKKYGSKAYTFYNASGEALWKYTVDGVFTVNIGVSAVCTTSVHNYEIYNSNWSCSSANSYASGNQAISNGEFVKKLLGITVERESFQVVLTCDSNGNLS